MGRKYRQVSYNQTRARKPNGLDFGKKLLTVESAVPPPYGRPPHTEGEIVVKEKEGKIRYEVPYDKLVIAVGCYSASLGIEGVSDYRIGTSG